MKETKGEEEVADPVGTQPRPSEFCVRCGERIKGVMALAGSLCGLCADDDKQA